MTPESDPHRLLDAVLGDAAPPDFRRATLERTLRVVRRRNRVRRVRRSLVALALLVALPWAVWHWPQVSRTQRRLTGGVVLVSTQPLAPGMSVESKPGDVRIVTSSASGVAVVETSQVKPLIHEVDDQQLLVMLAGRPAVLVRPAPGRAEVRFVNPADWEGFPVP